MTVKVLMFTMIAIFSGALSYAVRNYLKYRKSGDGANRVRVLFILCFFFFAIHYVRVFIGEPNIGYFSALGGMCLLLLYLREDSEKAWTWFKSLWRH